MTLVAIPPLGVRPPVDAIGLLLDEDPVTVDELVVDGVGHGLS
jgi:hypothetical protein